MIDLVPVEPFRERFASMWARGETTPGSVARELGWLRRPPPSMRVNGLIADSQRVVRMLGIARQPGRRTRGRYRKRIGYDLAKRLCEVLNLDPWEAGL